MRAKRSKKYRKIMSNYSLHFSFRTPYQVLCDSNFLHQCHAFHMPVQKSLENTLHGDARPYITQCSLAKAIADHKGKGRGDGKPVWLPPPLEVPLRYCKHKDAEGNEAGVIDEAECLVDLVGGQPKGNEVPKNKNHYVLATADEVEDEDKDGKKQRTSKQSSAQDMKPKRRKRGIDVRESARQIPGVPIIYVKRSVMVLEELSGISERVIRGAEKAKFKEGLITDPRSLKRKREEDNDDSDDSDKDIKRPSGSKSQGPKMKAKGPNPLSVRKKKVRPAPEAENRVQHEGEGVGEGQTKKRRRRRTHARKDDGQGDVTQTPKAEPAITQVSAEA